MRFGAGHLIDVLRGKVTDKVTQHGHERLSTFGIGADLSEAQWRGVLRQLVALGHVRTEGEYNTLALTDSARAVLNGEVPIVLREPREPRARRAQGAAAAAAPAPQRRGRRALEPRRAAALRGAEGLARRGGARAQPAGLRGLPRRHAGRDGASSRPDSLDALAGISGVGAKKLEAYGARSCACCASAADLSAR